MSAIIDNQGVNSNGDFPSDHRPLMITFDLSNTTSINKTSNDSKLLAFPNPFSVSATIELPNTGSHTLTIYDLAGKLVRTEFVSGEKIEIERGTLTKGIYFIELRSESHTYEAKLVVDYNELISYISAYQCLRSALHLFG